MYGLSGCGLKLVVGCRFSVVGFLIGGCRVTVVVGLSGCRVVVVVGGEGTGVVGGGAAALDCTGAGEAPAATPCDTTANFRSREAIAFATSAQTIAAAISVAASKKNLRQCIDCETATTARMLRHQS